jgi:hypothetical protein
MDEAVESWINWMPSDCLSGVQDNVRETVAVPAVQHESP